MWPFQVVLRPLAQPLCCLTPRKSPTDCKAKSVKVHRRLCCNWACSVALTCTCRTLAHAGHDRLVRTIYSKTFFMHSADGKAKAVSVDLNAGMCSSVAVPGAEALVGNSLFTATLVVRISIKSTEIYIDLFHRQQRCHLVMIGDATFHTRSREPGQPRAAFVCYVCKLT